MAQYLPAIIVKRYDPILYVITGNNAGSINVKTFNQSMSLLSNSTILGYTYTINDVGGYSQMKVVGCGGGGGGGNGANGGRDGGGGGGGGGAGEYIGLITDINISNLYDNTNISFIPTSANDIHSYSSLIANQTNNTLSLFIGKGGNSNTNGDNTSISGGSYIARGGGGGVNGRDDNNNGGLGGANGNGIAGGSGGNGKATDYRGDGGSAGGAGAGGGGGGGGGSGAGGEGGTAYYGGGGGGGGGCNANSSAGSGGRGGDGYMILYLY